MKKAFNKIGGILFSVLVSLLVFKQKVFAQGLITDNPEPARLREIESLFGNALIAIWALSIPYFIFIIISIGAQWMMAMGDEQKLAVLKQRGGRVGLSFAMVFGGYLVVRLVMNLLTFRDPDACFSSAPGLEDSATFQFFFPEVCSGVTSTP